MDTELIPHHDGELNHQLSAIEASIRVGLEEKPGGILLDRDNQTVEGILDRARHLPDSERYEVLKATKQLVPREENGKLLIGTQELNRGVLRLIHSRREAQEVESPFLGILETVSNTIIKESTIWMEMGNRCTVACHFCGVADKGPIATKLSFDSAFQTGQRVLDQGKYLYTYFASDPFDARWSTQGSDLDLSDLVKLWLTGINKASESRVKLVSGVPVGEELRMLRFAMEYAGDSRVDFEISQTSRNAEKVEAINVILHKLVGRRIHARNQSDDRVYRTGRNFLMANDIKPQEMLGPTCGDYVVISPEGIDAVYSVATDMAHPNGIIRTPLITELNGKMTYSFPKFHGDKGGPFSADLLEHVKDPEVIQMSEDGNGNWETAVTHPLEINPHRAFLRLLSTVNALFQGSGPLPDTLEGWESNEIASAYERMWTPKFMRSDLELVESYLNKQKDPWMRKYLDWILQVWPMGSKWQRSEHWK